MTESPLGLLAAVLGAVLVRLRSPRPASRAASESFVARWRPLLGPPHGMQPRSSELIDALGGFTLTPANSPPARMGGGGGGGGVLVVVVVVVVLLLLLVLLVLLLVLEVLAGAERHAGAGASASTAAAAAMADAVADFAAAADSAAAVGDGAGGGDGMSSAGTGDFSSGAARKETILLDFGFSDSAGSSSAIVGVKAPVFFTLGLYTSSLCSSGTVKSRPGSGCCFLELLAPIAYVRERALGDEALATQKSKKSRTMAPSREHLSSIC